MIFYVPFEQKKIEEEEQQQFLGFSVHAYFKVIKLQHTKKQIFLIFRFMIESHKKNLVAWQLSEICI